MGQTQGEDQSIPLTGPSHHPSSRTLYVGLEMLLGIGEGVPCRPVVGPGPHPRHPVGTVPRQRNPLDVPAPAPALKAPCWHGWSRCWHVLAVEIAAGVRALGDGVRSGPEIRRGAGGAHVEDRCGGALSTSGRSGAAWNPEKVNQLVLNRDQRLRGRDPFIGRGGGVLGNVPEVTGNAPQAENHLSRQGGPSNRDHRSRAALSPAQALRAHFGSVFVKRRHGTSLPAAALFSTHLFGPSRIR